MQPLILDRKSAIKRDPAPSRVAYRLQRLWLTPMFRSLLRTGVPAFLVVGAAAIFVSDEARVDMLTQKVTDIRRSVEERPEFMVNLLTLDGASDEVAQDIREILPLDFPVSSFDLDLEEMRQTVLGLDAVLDAQLRVRSGGILDIAVTERVPVVVWRSRDAVELLDVAGHRVAPITTHRFSTDLPIISGEGADRAVAEALRLLESASVLGERVRGLVRMGERRWDLVLTGDQRILLPETQPELALERVLALHQARELLSRDIVAVDMRHGKRPTIRLTEHAVEEMRRMKNIELGENRG
ncbi:cell division protein FtsQ [Brevirhabdus pacifica]|uniref:Cell division protein FtsQ n=1 Tax=Brevirhabdus pacifica TaxID=1267768 RepID=A0A1U7DKQ1_9RHOB|nr:cell division protein FtsQ/DivIB [Brevirhabdus pacifica]APX90566.1 cell division protein FtsQ [Brevirhabdus pacifica]PJJ85303.1 cell division protein FtsQ [Brevirhabdus pacifica]